MKSEREDLSMWLNYLKTQLIQKWQFCYCLLTLMLFQTCMNLFLHWNTKDDILEKGGLKPMLVPNGFHCMAMKTYI